MTNILIEHTRAPRMKYFFVKKFIPVFEQVVTKETWLSNKLGEPKYIKGQENFYSMPTPTSIPKKMWPIARVRRARTGQLRLL
jgi:hypothetical protein